MLLLGEHVHRAALATGIAVDAAGQLGHDAACGHAGCQHVTVVAVSGDDLVTFLLRHLHADDDSFLADIKVTETADEAHAVKLARLLFETADEQHFAIGLELFITIEIGHRATIRCLGCRLCACLTAGNGRVFSRSHSTLPMGLSVLGWCAP